jgi:hypothetical protein
VSEEGVILGKEVQKGEVCLLDGTRRNFYLRETTSSTPDLLIAWGKACSVTSYS